MDELTIFAELRPDDIMTDADLARLRAELFPGLEPRPTTDAIFDELTEPAVAVEVDRASVLGRTHGAALVLAVAAVAITVIGLGGLYVVADRSVPNASTAATKELAGNSSAPPQTSIASASDMPGWYEPLRAAIPNRFDLLALTAAAEGHAQFVAIDSKVGKSIELTLSSDTVSNADGTQSGDEPTSTSIETPHGWIVTTSAGLTAEASCNIGAKGRDFAGPPNYCDMSSTSPLTKAELHQIAATIASSELLDAALADADSIRPAPTEGVTDAVLEAIPDQHFVGDTTWTGADHIWDFAGAAELPETSIRVVTGVHPAPAQRTSASTRVGLYDDAAAFWIIDPTGTVVRISTTHPEPTSIDELERLANSLLDTHGTSTAVPNSPVPLTTTTAPSSTTARDEVPAFTPLLLDQSPAGFALLSAGFDPGPAGVGIAHYGRPDSDTQLQIVNRNSPDGANGIDEIGRTFQYVDGYGMVMLDGEGDGGCLIDVCSIGLQWDSQTFTSLKWVALDGKTLDPDDENIDTLLALIPHLVTDPTMWSPTGPTPR